MRFAVLVLTLVVSMALLLGLVFGVGLLRLHFAEAHADSALAAADAAPAAQATPSPVTQPARPADAPPTVRPVTNLPRSGSAVVLSASQASLHGNHLHVDIRSSVRADRQATSRGRLAQTPTITLSGLSSLQGRGDMKLTSSTPAPAKLARTSPSGSLSRSCPLKPSPAVANEC